MYFPIALFAVIYYAVLWRSGKSSGAKVSIFLAATLVLLVHDIANDSHRWLQAGLDAILISIAAFWAGRREVKGARAQLWAFVLVLVIALWLIDGLFNKRIIS